MQQMSKKYVSLESNFFCNCWDEFSKYAKFTALVHVAQSLWLQNREITQGKIFQFFTLQEFSRLTLLQDGLGDKNPRGII